MQNTRLNDTTDAEPAINEADIFDEAIEPPKSPQESVTATQQSFSGETNPFDEQSCRDDGYSSDCMQRAFLPFHDALTDSAPSEEENSMESCQACTTISPV